MVIAPVMREAEIRHAERHHGEARDDAADAPQRGAAREIRRAPRRLDALQQQDDAGAHDDEPRRSAETGRCPGPTGP